MSGNRGQDVAAVKGRTNRWPPKAPLRQPEHRWLARQECLAHQTCPAAVVRGQQAMTVDFDIKQCPFGADTRINDNYVNRFRRKVRNTSSKKESGETDILRWNLMAQVDELGLRVQAQNDSLHRRDVGRVAAEIGGQCDQRLHELWMRSFNPEPTATDSGGHARPSPMAPG